MECFFFFIIFVFIYNEIQSNNCALLVYIKELSPERSNMSLILFKLTLKYWPFFVQTEPFDLQFENISFSSEGHHSSG